jgi:uncharacterized protein
MRLFSGKIAALSDEIVKALVDNAEIECESKKEVARDVESVFASYLQTEREVNDKEVNDKAKSLLEGRGLASTEFNRVKRLTAEQKGIKVGDEMMDFLLDQLIEILMHSANVDEVFAEDHALRRRMRPILKKYLDIDEELDAEVRGKIKHVQEGSRTWEVEYQRVMGDIQRRKGV